MGKCSPLATLKNVMMPPFTSFLHQNVTFTFPFPYLFQSLYTNYSCLSTPIQQPILHTHPNTNSLLHYPRFIAHLPFLCGLRKLKTLNLYLFPSTSESTSSLFYRLDRKLLIQSGLQILWLLSPQYHILLKLHSSHMCLYNNF